MVHVEGKDDKMVANNLEPHYLTHPGEVIKDELGYRGNARYLQRPQARRRLRREQQVRRGRGRRERLLINSAVLVLPLGEVKL